jgi:hypothetical protein
MTAMGRIADRQKAEPGNSRWTFACRARGLMPALPPSVKFSRPTPTALYCTLSKKMAEVLGALSKINGHT